MFAARYFLSLYRINRLQHGRIAAARIAYRTAFAPLPF